MAGTVKIEGYREFLRACNKAEKDTKREVRAAFRKVGDVVRTEARANLRDYDKRSAGGLRTRVRQRGVSVEQSLRKTSDESRRRPNWGSYQMRHALVPALDDKKREVVEEMEEAFDRIANHFGKKG